MSKDTTKDAKNQPKRKKKHVPFERKVGIALSVVAIIAMVLFTLLPFLFGQAS